MRPPSSPELGRLVVSFFEDYLPAQRGMSSHTLRSYRDAIVLWLRFASHDAGRRLESMRVADLTVERIERFLEHLEAERHNGIATRNARLAAIRSFYPSSITSPLPTRPPSASPNGFCRSPPSGRISR